MKNWKLRTKMLASICSVVLLTYAVTIAIVTVKATQMAKKEAMDKSMEIAHRYSGVLKSKLESTMEAARILAQSFEGIKESTLTPQPEMLDAMVRKVL